MPALTTPRLILRAGGERDIAAFCAGLGDWSVAQWLLRPPYPYHEADARSFLPVTATVCGNGFHPVRVIAERSSDVMLGVISLEPHGAEVELGYWLLAASHGHGYVPEAAAALLGDAAERLADITTAIATTAPDNLASQAVLKRLGFIQIGEREAASNRRSHRRSLLFSRPLRAKISD